MIYNLQINFNNITISVAELTQIATDYNVSLDTSLHPRQVVYSGIEDWTAVEQAVNNLIPSATPRFSNVQLNSDSLGFQYNAI